MRLCSPLHLMLAAAIAATGTAPAAGAPPAGEVRTAPAPGPGCGTRQPAMDQPDAAALYAQRKRRGPTVDFDTVAARERALAHRDRMPRFSTRLRAELSRRPEATAAGVIKFIAPRLLGTWEPLGPGNIGGRTRTLVIDPDNPALMYAGGVSGGVWKTTDGGQSWSALGDRLANIAINSMALHPRDSDTLYVGTGEGHFREIVRGTWLPLRGAGIFVTGDGGATWRRLEATVSEDFHWVNDLVISRGDPDTIYAATRTGVHESSDGGVTWQRILDPEVHGGCLDLALRTDAPTEWLFAACGTFEQATVYRRKMTAGERWEAVLSEPGMGRTSLAIAPSDQRVIYALSASNVPGPGGVYEQALHAVYRSAGGGRAGTWKVRVDNSDPVKLNTLLLTNPIAASYADCGWEDENAWIPMGWYCNVIAVDPADPDIVWAAGVDLFRSDDGGRSWALASYWWAHPATPSYVHADQHAIVFHPAYDGSAQTTMYSASDGGISVTDNARAPVGGHPDAVCDPGWSSVRFTDLNHNLGITQFYHGAPFPGGDRYLGGTQDNGTLLGADSSGRDGWRWISGGDGGYVAVDFDDPDTLYAESQWFHFLRSDDGGLTFQGATNGITEPSGNFLFITPFVMDPQDPQRLWTGGRRVWRTDNGAVSWSAASPNPLGSGQVSALAVAPHSSQQVVVGTTDGFVYRSDQALAADGGTQWEASRPRQGYVSSLAFDPTAPGVVYATYAGFGGSHVWRSKDGGATWQAIDGAGSSALPDIPVHCIVVDPADPRRLYVGTDLGVFTSWDGGRRWAVENTGFANAVTEWLALGENADGEPLLFSFTHGRGAWRVKLVPVPGEPLRPSGRRMP